MDTPAGRTPIELGLDTFGDVTTGADGRPRDHADVLRHVVRRRREPLRDA